MNHMESISFFTPSEFTPENILGTLFAIGMIIAMTILVMKYLNLKSHFNDKVEEIRQYYDDLYNKERRKIMRIPTQIAELKNIVQEIERCYKQEVTMSKDEAIETTSNTQVKNFQEDS